VLKNKLDWAIPKILCATMRCAVLDTGRNSVTPSRIPRAID
jgi:hypothetical protein